jgi:hypothetical protein
LLKSAPRPVAPPIHVENIVVELHAILGVRDLQLPLQKKLRSHIDSQQRRHE